jgi:hypothetical protein
MKVMVWVMVMRRDSDLVMLFPGRLTKGVEPEAEDEAEDDDDGDDDDTILNDYEWLTWRGRGS